MIVRAAFSAALAVVGAAAAIVGASYGITQENGQVGAGFLPVVLGTLLAVLAAVDVVQILRRRDPADQADELTGVEAEADVAALDRVEETPDIDSLGRSQKQRNRMLAIVLGMTVVALLLVPVLGLLISLGLLVVAISTVVERRRILPSLLVGALAVGFIHLVFAELLGVPMPTGLIGLI
ncbi:tripartite tricarboxylate transporter TctB family protein [Agromyces sp. NPDC056523]|uniref:tripartite tricarboxylate transporter TctB family protein n=1 Tax=Agromyces sp. NPDC056523 TaxID=3345850 RepID=UPI003672FF11